MKISAFVFVAAFLGISILTHAGVDQCVHLQGTYLAPLGRHDSSSNPPVIMIDQEDCRLIKVMFTSLLVRPLMSWSSLDGRDGFFVVGDTIVEKYGDGTRMSIPTVHGRCSTAVLTMSLDSSANLVFAAKVNHCEDGFSGSLNQVYPKHQ